VKKAGFSYSYVLWLALFIPVAESFSQTISESSTHKIDSLQKIANTLSGTAKVDMLNRIAFEWFGFNNKIALNAALEAYELSDNLGYDWGKSEALVYKGLYERFDGDNEKGISFLKQGIALAEQSGNKKIHGYGLVQLAILFGAQGNNDSAFVLFDQAYKILQDSVNPAQLSTLYKNLALLHVRTFHKEKAWNYFLRALKIREVLKDPLLLSDIYIVIAEQYVAESNYEEAMKYVNRAEEISSQLNGDIESAYELKYQKAVILMRQSEYVESLKLFNELKTHYRDYTSKQGYVKLLTDIGYTLLDLGNYELSLNNFYEALQIANENKFEQEKARLFWLIGLVNNSLKQYELAEEFARKCLNISIQKQYIVEESTAYNLLGLVHDAKGDYDSALFFYNKALVLREKIKDPLRVAFTLNNIGTVLTKQKKYSQALQYQQRGLVIERDSENLWGIATSLQSLGHLYLKLGDVAKAKAYLDEAEAMAQKINARHVLSDIYLIKADWYESQGNVKQSLIYYKKYDQMKDSLYNNSLTNRMASLQSEFTLLQKNQEIEILNKDKALRDREIEVQQTRVRQQRTIIIFGIVALLLIVAGAYMVYSNYMKVSALNRKIQEDSEEMQVQSEELQVSNQMIVQINEGLEEMVEARTKELKQAFKELDTFFYRSSHDFRRPLTTFMGLAEVAKITVQDEQALGLFEKVNETARGLDKMLVKLQSISDVGSTQLIFKEIFFNEIFNEVADSFRDELKGKDIRLNVEMSVTDVFSSYPPLIRIIIENLVENSIMFSKPHQTIKLMAQAVDGGASVEIEDTGYGIEEEYIDRVFDMYFRAHEQSKGNGLGLYIVKRVVEKLKGTIQLTSKVGVGTKVVVFLPHQANQIGFA